MCTVHRTVHRLSCYMNIPKYSKLFIQIVRKTSFRETSCPGKWLSGKRPLPASPTNPPSYIRIRAIVQACGRGQTDTHTDAREHISRGLLRRNVMTSPAPWLTGRVPVAALAFISSAQCPPFAHDTYTTAQHMRRFYYRYVVSRRLFATCKPHVFSHISWIHCR